MFLSTSGLGINVFFSGLLWQQPGLYQASTQHRSVWLTLKLPHNRPIFMGCSEQSRGSRTKLTEVHMCSCFTGTSVRRHLLWEKQQRKQRKKTGKNKKKKHKTKGNGGVVDWWQDRNNAIFKKTVSLGKVTDSNSDFFSPNNFLIQSWGTTQSQL